MAKSRIIKDIANSNIDLQIALKRTKVLLSELDNKNILDWINSEIEGYSDNTQVPDYRMVSGRLIGNYIIGRSYNRYVEYKKTEIALNNVSDDYRNEFYKTPIKMNIAILQQLLNNNSELNFSVAPELYGTLAQWNGTPFMKITSAYINIGPDQISYIIRKVENKLIDILILLEKNFGSLDELDIDIENKTDSEKKKLLNELSIIIYENNSINIGNNNNKIEDSKIASTITENIKE